MSEKNVNQAVQNIGCLWRNLCNLKETESCLIDRYIEINSGCGWPLGDNKNDTNDCGF